jgi:hypothetical protein
MKPTETRTSAGDAMKSRGHEDCPLSTQNKVNKRTYNGTLLMILREKQQHYRQLGST